MSYLLTRHATLLCRHRVTGAFVQRPVTAAPDETEPLDTGIPPERLQFSFADHLRGDAELAIEVPEGSLSGFRIQRARDQRSVNLGRDGRFLCAASDGATVELGELEDQDRAAFLPLSDSDLRVVREVLAGDWLIRSTGELVEAANVRLLPSCNLAVGPLTVDLRWQLPFDLSEWPHRLTVLRDGWRIEQLCRYRPVVYYAAFGDDAILEQFSLSVRSLFEFGQYKGDVAVLTDRSPNAIVPFLSLGKAGHYVLLPNPAHDELGVMAARYTIGDWQDAGAFQPLLYVDTDTVFDADVTPMLRAVAMADRIAAPAEYVAPLWTNPPAARGLLQLDDRLPPDAHGFDAGILGVPNLARHGETLALICRVLANHAALQGRELPTFAGQDIANYVAYRQVPVDTSMMSQFVRHADGVPDADRRSGLVHFWRTAGAGPRVEAMREYMRRLEQRLDRP